MKQAIIDADRGELFLPYHLPFSYDYIGRKDTLDSVDGSIFWVDQLGNMIDSTDAIYWGNNASELENMTTPLNDPNNNCCYDSDSEDDGPDMYYRNSTNYNQIAQFLIKSKYSPITRSSTIKLDGFMIVPNSETVTLNGVVLNKGIDYTINYDTGMVDFSNEAAMDATADLYITYEQNTIISFDQKLLAGTHFKYDIKIC